MKSKLFYFVLILFLFSVFFNIKFWINNRQSNSEIIKEKIVTRYVHIKDSTPKEISSRIIGTLTVAHRCDSVHKSIDSLSVLSDSIDIVKEQKVFSDDSTYTAFVSGYRPNLDSIIFRQKELNYSVVNIKSLPSSNLNCIRVGFVGGYGYGFSSCRFEPFIGIGLSFSIPFSFN